MWEADGVKWEMEGMWPVHDGYIAYMCNSRYYPPCREVNDDGNIWWMPLLPQVNYMHGPMHQRLVICVTTTFTFALKQWSHVLALFPASHTLSSYCLYVGKATAASDGSWGFDREGTRLAYQVYTLPLPSHHFSLFFDGIECNTAVVIYLEQKWKCS